MIHRESDRNQTILTRLSSFFKFTFQLLLSGLFGFYFVSFVVLAIGVIYTWAYGSQSRYVAIGLGVIVISAFILKKRSFRHNPSLSKAANVLEKYRSDQRPRDRERIVQIVKELTEIGLEDFTVNEYDWNRWDEFSIEGKYEL